MLVNISKVTGMVSMLVAENHVFERIKENAGPQLPSKITSMMLTILTTTKNLEHT
jgi:hypothetical protein